MFYIILITFMLLGGVLAVLTVENFSRDVSLSLFLWQIPSLPLGLILLISFLLGALVLYIVSVASAWQDRRQIRELRLRVAELEQISARIPTDKLPGTVPIVPMPGMPPLQSTTPPQE